MTNNFFDYGSLLYSAFLQKKTTATVPAEYVAITEKVAKKVGWNMQIKAKTNKFQISNFPENKKVMIGLSSGLDSVYLLHKLQEKGYEVTGVHISGLNKSFAKTEAEQAKKIATKAGVDFISVKFSPPQQTFADNPFKNQLVLSIMLDLGVKRNIYRYALGSDWTTPLSEAVVGYTITDSIEVNEEFWKGVQLHFPQAELLFINAADKKFDRLKYLYTKQPYSLQNVSSCISPLRFREHLHEQNEQKYKIKLLNGRCGSCYKCCMEYILLTEAGLMQKNDKFYAHCWHTLATSKTAHRPDLFAEKLPLEKRLKNLLNYGS